MHHIGHHVDAGDEAAGKAIAARDRIVVDLVLGLF